jgi:hypothetical protein
MVSFSAAVFALLVGTCHAYSDSLRRRRLSFDFIAGYAPASLVTDHVSPCACATAASSNQMRNAALQDKHVLIFQLLLPLAGGQNALDLDQAELEQQLARGTDGSFATAKSIYTDGAFSKSFATVKLSTALSQPLTKGTQVIGKTETGDDVNGKLLKDFPIDSIAIDVQYETNSVQRSYVGCQVGANPSPFTDGCKYTAFNPVAIFS